MVRGPQWAPPGLPAADPGTRRCVRALRERLEPLYESVNSGTSWDAPIVYRAEGAVQLTVGAGVHASTFGGAAEYVEWNGFTVDQATATFRNGLTTISAIRFVLRCVTPHDCVRVPGEMIVILLSALDWGGFTAAHGGVVGRWDGAI